MIEDNPFKVVFNGSACKIADFLNTYPEAIYPIWLYEEVSQPTVAKELSQADMGLYLYSEEQRLLEGADPVENYEKVKLKENVAELLKTLSPRERKIIQMRFGMLDGAGHTLEEVGRAFHVTRERIRSIETKVLDMLKNNPLTKEFIK